MRHVTQWIARLNNLQILMLVVFLALGTSVVSFLLGTEDTKGWVSGVLQNFSTEMLGAFITFLLFDIVIRGREELKRRLIKQFRSPHPEITSKALSELKKHGWLYDGSLRGTYLSFANWSGLDLEGIDLEGARLRKVKLINTTLRKANLEGTNVSVDRLVQASALQGAIMPDGRRYDGRLRLPGDLERARRMGISLEDEESMAKFYGVSVEEYKEGQRWANEQLDLIRQRSSSFFEKPWWERLTKTG